MPPPDPAWVTEFRSFSWLHAVSLVWTVGAMALACILGRRWRAQGGEGEIKEQKLAGAWAGFMVCVNLWSLIYWQLPDNFTLRESLPLHLCDLACILAPLVFLTEWRLPRTLLFFWGLGLSSQAFVTPTLAEGVGHLKYYLFWLVHLSIVGSAVYDLSVRRYRPTARDLLWAVALSIGYCLGMVMVNHSLGSNYGYVGDTLPGAPTPIDHLGPWPRRVFYMTAIVVVGFCAMFLISLAVDAVLGGASPFAGRLWKGRGLGGLLKRGKGELVHCSQCGHDLAGFRGDACPECGTPIHEPRA
jgi:hypothetical integral membrane protein (TIGR02206 family)